MFFIALLTLKAIQFILFITTRSTVIINISKEHKNSAAIGIFDSGVGGLSIAQCVAKSLPHENLIYVADTLNAPYGEKSLSFINERVIFIAQELIKKDIKALVVACNTATVNSIELLRSKVSIPVIGVEPAIKPASKLSQSKKVAILVTQATSNNSRFNDLVAEHKNGAEVFIQPCPGLVEFIEQNKQNSEACLQLLESYINPLISQGVDTLVLGCTHYPFALPQINNITNNKINIIETSAPVTLQLTKKLEEAGLCANKNQLGNNQFYSSQPSEQQQRLFSLLWKDSLKLKLLES
jgi:glutamate racemase